MIEKIESSGGEGFFSMGIGVSGSVDFDGGDLEIRGPGEKGNRR